MNGIVRWSPLLVALLSPTLFMLMLAPVMGYLGVYVGILMGIVLGFTTYVFMPRYQALPGPVEDAGTILGQAWAERDGKRYLVSADDATEVATHDGSDHLQLQPDGWDLTLSRRPLGPIALSAAKAAMAGALFLSATNLVGGALLGGDSILEILPILPMAFVATSLLMFVPGVLFLVMLYLLQAFWPRPSISRKGNVLHYDGQRFHLANAGTSHYISQGVQGSKLVLTNKRESMTIYGRYADLRWVAAQVEDIDESEQDQVPESLRHIRAPQTEQH